MDLENIVREYINKSIHLSLATSHKDKPWVCEVHFVYDERLNIYFRSLKSRRHSQEITQNPNVAGNIVKQHGIDEYPHAIYFAGTAYIVKSDKRYSRFFSQDRMHQKKSSKKLAKKMATSSIKYPLLLGVHSGSLGSPLAESMN